jgi:hypothetical protein
MLQAHSHLWNYLWVAPNVLLLVLGLLLWRRGLSRQCPAFLAFVILSGVGDLALFGADVSPSVSAVNFWRIDWASLLTESILKFFVIGEIFSRVLTPYPSVSRLGKALISGFGAVLVLLATLVAAFSHGDSTMRLISGAHLLEQTVFIIEMGLVLFLFVFAAYFRLSWDRLSFGVLLGFGLSACGHLTGWAVSTNADPSIQTRTLLDFFDMGIHNLCVLIWFYYLLVPQKVVRKSAVSLPENNLAVWNRELERLLQQ